MQTFVVQLIAVACTFDATAGWDFCCATKILKQKSCVTPTLKQQCRLSLVSRFRHGPRGEDNEVHSLGHAMRL